MPPRIKRRLYLATFAAATILLWLLLRTSFSPVLASGEASRGDSSSREDDPKDLNDSSPNPAMRVQEKGLYLRHFAAISSVLATIFIFFNYYLNAPERQQNRRYQAWQIVTAMEGKKGEGGRRRALADLLASNVSLSGIVLDNAIIEDLRLQYATLDRASFCEADFLGASFVSASLREAKLHNVRLRQSQLDSASLNYAYLDGALLVDSSFREADLSWVTGDRAVFNSSVFVNANFSNSKLNSPLFRNADISGAEFLEVNFGSSDFFRVTMHGSRWWDSRVIEGKFLYAVGDDVRVVQSTFDGATFERARLSGLVVTGGSFRGAVFRGTRLEGARFEGVDLSTADFSNAIMHNTVIDDDCNLAGAIFSNLDGLKCSKCGGG